MTDRSTVAVLIPSDIRAQVLTEETEARLATLAHVIYPPNDATLADDLPRLISGATALLTGWKTPPLSDALLAAHPETRLIAHTAGTIRRLVPEAAMTRGVHVTHAAAMIADAVAEWVIAQTLTLLRDFPAMNAAMHGTPRDVTAAAQWNDLRERYPGRMLGSLTVGVVGAGRVGRRVIALLRPFGCVIRVYDPLLSADDAAAMGVERAELDVLIASADVLTLHVPVLPETEGMIGADQLALLRDGAVFLNAARSVVVDEAALLRELLIGRFAAALDVFGTEPLPLDDHFRDLPDVLLTPHAAGHTIDTHQRQGAAMVDEIARFLAGKPLQYEVTAAMLPTMA